LRSEREQDPSGEEQHNQGGGRDVSNGPDIARRVKNDSHDQ
jgi:hypothetical protein